MPKRTKISPMTFLPQDQPHNNPSPISSSARPLTILFSICTRTNDTLFSPQKISPFFSIFEHSQELRTKTSQKSVISVFLYVLLCICLRAVLWMWGLAKEERSHMQGAERPVVCVRMRLALAITYTVIGYGHESSLRYAVWRHSVFKELLRWSCWSCGRCRGFLMYRNGMSNNPRSFTQHLGAIARNDGQKWLFYKINATKDAQEGTCMTFSRMNNTFPVLCLEISTLSMRHQSWKSCNGRNY